MAKKQDLFGRTIINDPKLQLGVPGFFVILFSINLGFILILFKLLESRIKTEISQMDETNKKYFFAIFDDLYQTILNSSLAFGLFVIIFSLLGGILITQHISGPSFAIKKFLIDVNSGVRPRFPLKFRKHDFFGEHAELLNQIYIKYINKANQGTELSDKNSDKKPE